MATFLYLKEGPRILVPGDRHSLHIEQAVLGHARCNQGAMLHLPELQLTQYHLGPCLAESLTPADAFLCLQTIEASFAEYVQALRQERFLATRYTLLNGQRVIWVQTSKGINHSLFVQDSHSDFSGSGYPLWRQEFPPDAWD